MNTQSKSLKFNMILNATKTILLIIFPLITTPYVSRVLGVENIGKYNFSTSFVEYFTIISGSAMTTYCIKEGAKIRDNKKEIGTFIDEVFSINFYLTLIEFAVLIVLVTSASALRNYRELIYIMSFSVFASTLGREWICSVYEDYVYITKRTILIKIITILLTFVLVRSDCDLYKYALLYTISLSLTSLLNLYYTQRYKRIKLLCKCNLKRHCAKMFFIAVSTTAVMIYTTCDTIMLGFMTNDFEVGLYGTSSKLYMALKTVLSAIITVSIPRFSYYLGSNSMDKFNTTLSKLMNSMISLIIPITIGVCVFSKDIIVILFGYEYEGAWSSLSILCIAAAFAMLAYITGQCVMVPLGKEREMMFITIASALMNVILNFFLIPIFKGNGAATTTVIAELVTLVATSIYIKNYVQIKNVKSTTLKVIAGCFVEFFVCAICLSFISSKVLRISVGAIVSILLYVVIECMMKNVYVFDLLQQAKNILGRFLKRI